MFRIFFIFSIFFVSVFGLSETSWLDKAVHGWINYQDMHLETVSSVSDVGVIWGIVGKYPNKNNYVNAVARKSSFYGVWESRSFSSIQGVTAFDGKNENVTIYFYYGSMYYFNSLHHFIKVGSTAIRPISVSVGMDNTLWAVGSDGLAYFFDQARGHIYLGPSYSLGGSNVKQISAGSSDYVWILLNSGQFCFRILNEWNCDVVAPKPMIWLSVSSDNKIACVGDDGFVYA